MTDAAFLAALAQTPHDADLRAVYADFLDDAGRGDEAELLRAEEAMRRLPVWSDEYWALKARRNELRRVCPAEWVRLTRCDGSRPERMFRDGYPAAISDRWRFARAFAEAWSDIEMPDIGGRASEIADEESRVGLKFGPSLREFIAFSRDLEANAERLEIDRRCHLSRPPQLDHLVVVTSSLMNECWAIRRAQVGEAEPDLVKFVRSPRGYRLTRGEYPSQHSLTHFALAGLTRSLPHSISLRLRVAPGDLEAEDGPFTRVGCHPQEHPWRLESSGVLVALPEDGQAGFSIARVVVSRHLRWSEIPKSVLRLMAQPTLSRTVRELSESDVKELTDLYAGEPPEWVRPGD